MGKLATFWSRFATCVGVLALTGYSASLQAQGTASSTESQARGLVKQMSDFLASQSKFSVETRSTLEVVLVSGQKIQFDHSARQSIQRPNKLYAERVGELVEQAFYYDGKSLTLYNPSQKVYASVAAPDTLEGMLDYARTSLDIVAPASDLIYRNAYDILMQDVQSGFVVGKAVIEGVRCDHLAFRASQVDWQIWIEEGKTPLPRKFVITTRDLANAPQFTVVTTKWDLKPALTAQTFHFSPPKDAKKVDFLPAGVSAK